MENTYYNLTPYYLEGIGRYADQQEEDIQELQDDNDNREIDDRRDGL